MRELIDYANKNPGKLTFGAGGGTGSSLYLATELLKSKTGIKVTIVPYKGAGPALNDLLGGHIDAMFDAMPVMAPAGQGRQGQAARGHEPQALVCAARRADRGGVGRATRSPAGSEFWRPPAHRPRSPSACATRWRRRSRRPTPFALLDTQGMQPLATQPGEWRDYLKSELDRYAKIIKDANIKPE